MKFVLSLTAVFCFAHSDLAQNYYTLYPGQEAIISFHFDGPTIVNGVVPDVLAVEIGGGVPFGSHISGTEYSLMDGNTVLGTAVRSGLYSFGGQAFRALDNALPGYTPAPSAPVDFSSIRNGSIQGHLLFEPLFTNPTETDWVQAEFEFYLMKQYDYSSGRRAPDPIIDSIQIVSVPEPSSVALLATAILFVACRVRCTPRMVNKTTGANAGGPCQLPIPTLWAARIAQFFRSPA